MWSSEGRRYGLTAAGRKVRGARVRVVIADDSLLVREGIASLLRRPRPAADRTAEGLRAAHEIRGRHPQIGIVILPQHVEVGTCSAPTLRACSSTIKSRARAARRSWSTRCSRRHPGQTSRPAPTTTNAATRTSISSWRTGCRGHRMHRGQGGRDAHGERLALAGQVARRAGRLLPGRRHRRPRGPDHAARRPPVGGAVPRPVDVIGGRPSQMTAISAAVDPRLEARRQPTPRSASSAEGANIIVGARSVAVAVAFAGPPRADPAIPPPFGSRYSLTCTPTSTACGQRSTADWETLPHHWSSPAGRVRPCHASHGGRTSRLPRMRGRKNWSRTTTTKGLQTQTF